MPETETIVSFTWRLWVAMRLCCVLCRNWGFYVVLSSFVVVCFIGCLDWASYLCDAIYCCRPENKSKEKWTSIFTHSAYRQLQSCHNLVRLQVADQSFCKLSPPQQLCSATDSPPSSTCQTPAAEARRWIWVLLLNRVSSFPVRGKFLTRIIILLFPSLVDLAFPPLLSQSHLQRNPAERL